MAKASRSSRGKLHADRRRKPEVPPQRPQSPPPGGARRRDGLILAGILAAGLAARGLYLTERVGAPDFDRPAVDAGFHDYWGRGLATGDWSTPPEIVNPRIPEKPFFRPPGYPYFLALVYRLTGHSYLAAGIAQMLLGLLNCVLAFLIGRRWFGRLVGLIVAAAMALYWVFIYFEGELHAPALLICLLLTSVWLLGLWAEKMHAGLALAAGAGLGLCALIRPNALLLIPVAGAWTGWIALRRGRRKRILSSAAAVILPAVAVVAPATIRNYVVAKDFVLVSSNAGINLFIGNNEKATGTCAVELPGLGRFGTCFDYPGIVSNLEKKLGRPLKHSEVSAWFTAQAGRFIRENPGRFLHLTLKKFCLFWGPEQVGHNKELSCERESSGVLKYLPGGFPIVLSLAIVGFAFLTGDARRGRRGEVQRLGAPARWEMSILILPAILVLSLSILPFFVAARYRVPIIPLLLLFASYGGCRLGRLAMERRYRRLAAYGAVWVALLVAASIPVFPRQPRLAEWYFAQGAAHARKDQMDQAIAKYRQALRQKPGMAMAHNNLGMALLRQGKIDEAIPHFEQALASWPDHVNARYNLGLALQRKGKTDEAIAHWQTALSVRRDANVLYSLGTALLEKGHVEPAIAHLREAIELRPDHALAHNGLGTAVMRQGRLSEAVAHWTEALRLNDELPDAHNNLGMAMLRARKLDRAINHFKKAVQARPDYALAHNNLGMALAQSGKIDQAVRHWTEALKCEPNLPEAHSNLGKALLAAGETDRGVAHLEEAIRIRPDYAQAHYAIGQAMLAGGKLADAAAHLAAAVKHRPGWADAHFQLGQALQLRGEFAQALEHYRRALQLKGESIQAMNNLAWLLATCPDGEVRNGPEAVRLAERACRIAGRKSPSLLDTLAAAQAEAGLFEQAVRTAQEALDLAKGRQDLVARLEARLRSYRARRPWRQAPQGN